MISIPLILLLTHFVGDFILQPDWMAINKSKRWDALFGHVSIYSLFFIPWGYKFVLVTFILHFITDAITSRITSKLWFFKPMQMHVSYNGPPICSYEGGSRHWFFVMIGFDQLIHYVTLALTLRLLS